MIRVTKIQIRNSIYHGGILGALTLSQLAYLSGNMIGGLAFFTLAVISTYFILPLKLRLLEHALLVLFLSIPFSFISVFGQPYSENQLSLYNIALIYFFATCAMSLLAPQNKLRTQHEALVISLCVVFLASLAFSGVPSPSKLEWAKTAASLIPYAGLIPLVMCHKSICLSRRRASFLNISFAVSCLSVAITIAIQKIAFSFGIELGSVIVMNLVERQAFISLMADRSQIAVFLSAGSAIFLMLVILPERIQGNFYSVAALAAAFICIASSGFTSGRAGPFSLLGGIILGICTRAVPARYAAKALLAAFPVVLLAVFVIASQRQIEIDSVGSDEERKRLSYKYSALFISNMPYSLIWGIGLGSGNHEILTDGYTPHNIILDCLVNGGVPMLSIICVVGVCVFRLTGSPAFFIPLLVILCGGLVSPSMLESRFFSCYLFLCCYRLGCNTLMPGGRNDPNTTVAIVASVSDSCSDRSLHSLGARVAIDSTARRGVAASELAKEFE